MQEKTRIRNHSTVSESENSNTSLNILKELRTKTECNSDNWMALQIRTKQTKTKIIEISTFDNKRVSRYCIQKKLILKKVSCVSQENKLVINEGVTKKIKHSNFL